MPSHRVLLAAGPVVLASGNALAAWERWMTRENGRVARSGTEIARTDGQSGERSGTLGVEEEFLLVEPDDGRTLARSRQVLDEASSTPGVGEALHSELQTCQVEAATGVCSTLTEVRGHLVDGRLRLGRAARTCGARLMSTGTPALGAHAPALSRGERFDRITETYAGMVECYQACGCHVHVGVPDREMAVAVLGHLRPWLPTLLALSANSPFHHGWDTGHQSWRIVEQSRFPGFGVPPLFDSAEGYDEEVARLVDCGVLMDPQMSFWLARASGRFSTVEFRVADAARTVDDAVLQAGLSRAMVTTAVWEIERGGLPEVFSEQVLAAAVWAAARYGPNGTAIDPWRERRSPAHALVRELLRWARPALIEAGDFAMVQALVDRVLQEGSGAVRQRRASSEGPTALVEALTADRSLERGMPETLMTFD